MAQIHLAHLRDQGIDFAVFDADATVSTDSARSKLLAELTAAARAQGLRVQKSALAFREFGRITFFGTPDLVRYLSRGWTLRWTHVLDL